MLTSGALKYGIISFLLTAIAFLVYATLVFGQSPSPSPKSTATPRTVPSGAPRTGMGG